jgi:selenocysteine-specific elongation factor
VGDEPGASAETVRAKILPGIDRSVFQALVKLLSEQGKIIRRGDKLLLPGVEAKINLKSDAQQALESKILDILSQHHCLEIEELVKQAGGDKKEVTSTLAQLGKEKKVAIVAIEFAALTSKINEAHKHLGEIWRAKKDISPADFRDALGTTRKYAMALLSYFDDQGITRRLNNSRVLLKTAKVD